MSYSPDVTTATIKMIFSLGLVLALVWGLYRLAKKKIPMINGGGKGQLIQVVENHSLGVKKNIAMVKVPGSVLILGIGGDRVGLLTQIDDPAVIQKIEAAQSSPGTVMSFKEQLRRFTHVPAKKEARSNEKLVSE